jgi:hypothetical protein
MPVGAVTAMFGDVLSVVGCSVGTAVGPVVAVITRGVMVGGIGVSVGLGATVGVKVLLGTGVADGNVGIGVGVSLAICTTACDGVDCKGGLPNLDTMLSATWLGTEPLACTC